MSNSNRNDGPEQFGGVIQEQSDAMQRARNYGGRFGQPAQIDRAREAERQAEIDRVKD